MHTHFLLFWRLKFKFTASAHLVWTESLPPGSQMGFLLCPHLVGAAAKETSLFWRMLIPFMSLALGTNHLVQAP